MPKITSKDASTPALQPVGTPPHGGRWTWDVQAAEWLLLPEPDAPADAAANPTTAPE